MGAISKRFIEHFHNLSGDTIKQKRQNLFRLFLEEQLSLCGNPEELEFVATHLEPDGHLEKIFRIDFLIYFRRFNELYEEFCKGDEITSSKVAKQEWFFQHACKDLGPEKFVNDVLPTMSYSVKMKILKKSCPDEKQSDKIFDALCKRYGIFLATVFLPKCSVKKIQETLKSQPIKLTPVQLQTIYDKDPNLIYLYLEERTKHEGGSTFMNNNPIFVYVAQKNPQMFLDLFKKYNFKIRLGHRTTKRYINTQKINVLTTPKSYVNILNSNSLVRKLGPELTDLFFKNDSENSEPYWPRLLQYYPKKRQFGLYKSAYDKVFYHKFGENLDLISEEVLKIIPDPLEREKLAKLKLEKEENELYLKYVRSDYCLREIMEKLNQTTVSGRSNYVRIVTECCVLNKDVNTLLKICEIVCVRFKNDDRNIRVEFCDALNDSSIFDKFSEAHWKFIMEILTTVQIKDEWVCNEILLRSKYLTYLIENNKSIKEAIAKYPNCLNDLVGHAIYYRTNSKIVKAVLCELIEVGLHKPKDESDSALYDCRLLARCKTYNRENPKDPVNVYDNPRFFKSIKFVLENETSVNIDVATGIEYFICRKDTSKEISELKAMFFKSFEIFGGLSACLWFLKNEPIFFQENFDQFLANFAVVWGINKKKLWRLIKKYNHLSLDKRTVEFCTTKLKEEGYNHKKKLIMPLSMLSTPASHLEFVKSYIPTSTKVDLSDDEVKDLYLIQCQLTKFLHFVNSPASVLPVALQFCKGDYLKSALNPVYSCIYRLPEIETKLFIDTLDENKAVSVQKHAMFLSCVIYDKATVYNCLKRAAVPSLMSSLKYFVKNPSDALWELVELKLSNVEKKDLDVFKTVMKITIPFEYKSKYIEAIWKVLDKYKNNELKKILIKQIDKNIIENLHPQFAYKMIEGSIFKIAESNDLVAKLLIHVNDNGKFEFISKILSAFKKNCWKCKVTERTSRIKLADFISHLFETYMELKELDREFAMKFATKFEEIFHPSEAFEEIIMISFMKSKGETTEKCGKLLIELHNDFVKIYGRFVVNLFADTVNNSVLPHLLKTESEKIKLCYFLHKFKQSVDDNLLIIKLLPEDEPKYTEDFKLYSEILTELRRVVDDSVQLQFNRYLKRYQT